MIFPPSSLFLPDRSSETTTDRDMCVCGFSTVDNMALLNLEGSGMMGVPGIAHRLFGSLQRAGISVTLIAQASSEHSISFATKAADAQDAKKGKTGFSLDDSSSSSSCRWSGGWAERPLSSCICGGGVLLSLYLLLQRWRMSSSVSVRVESWPR